MKRILYVGNKLKRHGFNPTSIDVLGEKLEREGFKLYYTSEKKSKLLRLLDILTSLFKYRNKVDFIIIDTYSTLNFYYALSVSIFCRFFKISYICKLEGGNLPLRIKNNPILSHFIFSKAYRIIAPSQFIFDSFKNLYHENLLLIHNFFDFNSNDINETKIIAKPFNILWVRSFDPIYNPMMAIKVVELLIKKHPNIFLYMVGPDKKKYKSVIERYVVSNNLPVFFTGKLEKEEIYSLIKSCHLFINTSNIDNFPVSILESMAFGLPVISTNVGGISEMIKNETDGCLVSINDVEKMAFYIEKVLNDELFFNKLSRNSIQKVELFRWENIKQKWIDLLL